MVQLIKDKERNKEASRPSVVVFHASSLAPWFVVDGGTGCVRKPGVGARHRRSPQNKPFSGTSSFLLLLAMPGAPSSFLLLVGTMGAAQSRGQGTSQGSLRVRGSIETERRPGSLRVRGSCCFQCNGATTTIAKETGWHPP